MRDDGVVEAKSYVQRTAGDIRALRKEIEAIPAKPASTEAVIKAELMAHTTLALRHIEDAESRLDRVLGALKELRLFQDGRARSYLE